jgi:class 3 adenylate cyclase
MGSTALQERLDPESVNRVMDAYYQAVRGPVEAAGGTVVQLLGDGVFCAFGIPRIAEPGNGARLAAPFARLQTNVRATRGLA